MFQVGLRSQGRTHLDEDRRKYLKKYCSNLEGKKEEEKLYEKLKTLFLKENVKNTIVINGYKNIQENRRETGEFDFLIISEPWRTIIQVEVKSSYKQGSADKAFQQLEKGKVLFQEKIPFPDQEQCHWNYVKVVKFAETSISSCCAACQPFVLLNNSDVNQWWTDILRISQPTQTATK
jgi:Holliday junction resolvase-like predicted endonuclease